MVACLHLFRVDGYGRSGLYRCCSMVCAKKSVLW